MRLNKRDKPENWGWTALIAIIIVLLFNYFFSNRKAPEPAPTVKTQIWK